MPPPSPPPPCTCEKRKRTVINDEDVVSISPEFRDFTVYHADFQRNYKCLKLSDNDATTPLGNKWREGCSGFGSRQNVDVISKGMVKSDLGADGNPDCNEGSDSVKKQLSGCDHFKEWYTAPVVANTSSIELTNDGNGK